MKVTVKKTHRSDVLIPFTAKKSEIVKGKEEPTKWEGWLYCENGQGIKGWVPKAFLTIIPEKINYYMFNRDYNAFEIPASKGEVVEVKEIESGWALVVTEIGKVGWIPLENLDLE
ncbi:MAG: SH3 domain-containing protein [Candidatus Lokiarchaeota archaeon]|jgi:hypothetical protein